MQYQISFRKIVESDLNVTRPFIPEAEDYEMYLSALIEDIGSLDCVIGLNQEHNNVIITVGSEADFEALHAKVRDLLNDSYHDKLTVDSGFREFSKHA